MESQSKLPEHFGQLKDRVHFRSHSSCTGNDPSHPGGCQIPSNDSIRIGQKTDRQIESVQLVSDQLR